MKIKFNDWMGDDYQDSDDELLFQQQKYEGKKGHLLLQLQKTYKGDDRFNLNEEFDVDIKEKKRLPDTMMGSLSKREQDDLFGEHAIMKKKEVISKEDQVQLGEIQWDPDIGGIQKEKAQALKLLGCIVPQSEVFLKSAAQEDSRSRHLHIQRFDPTKPNLLLIKNGNEDQKKDDGRMEILKKKKENFSQKLSESVNNSEVRGKQLQVEAKKEVKIESQTWKDIISKKKQTTTNNNNFILTFDAPPEIEIVLPPKIIKEKKEKKQKEQVVYKKKSEEELTETDKRKMEKKRNKKMRQKQKKKSSISFKESDDVILGKMKHVYGEEKDEEKMKRYIKYQKLILEAKNKKK